MLSRRSALQERLNDLLRQQRLPGLGGGVALARFVDQLVWSEQKVQHVRRRQFQGTRDPESQGFDPLRCIVDHFEDGNPDEAIWVSFLYTHFGHDVPETTRLFYGRFGDGAWTWDSVLRNPRQVRQWLAAKKRSERLAFGNHRKFEAKKLECQVNTAAVVESFVDWVKAQNTTSAYHALRSFTMRGASAGERFSRLFSTFQVLRFGRTAKFDLLCLLGNLRLLNITPDDCYLKQSTGPRAGALLMTTGSKHGRLSDCVIASVRRVRDALDVEAQVFEDALCNWQKNAFRQSQVPDCSTSTRPDACSRNGTARCNTAKFCANNAR